MRTVPFGTGGRRASQVVCGMMRIADRSDAEIRDLYETARGAEIDVFDHADLYGVGQRGGGMHHCERRFGEALRLSASEREQIILQTKTGIVADPRGYDASFDHIVSSVEESLRALATDYLDMLLLHRPDALVEPDEVARAFDHLASTGKVRAFGVSNHTPAQIALLRSAVSQPLVVDQVQLSLTHAAIITQGLSANIVGQEESVTRDGGGLLDYCRLEGIRLQAWAPFRLGSQDGVLIGAPEHPELNALLEELADAYEVTPTAVAAAWITRHPADIQVVVGTTTPSRLLEAAAGSDLRLTREEWYGLLIAAGHHLP